MFIKLTNAAEQLSGQDILVNFDMVVSVLQGVRRDSDNNEEKITLLFIPPHGTWEVKETPEQIMKLMKR